MRLLIIRLAPVCPRDAPSSFGSREVGSLWLLAVLHELFLNFFFLMSMVVRLLGWSRWSKTDELQVGDVDDLLVVLMLMCDQCTGGNENLLSHYLIQSTGPLLKLYFYESSIVSVTQILF